MNTHSKVRGRRKLTGAEGGCVVKNSFLLVDNVMAII
jgi:hypothetical protein